MRRRRHAPAERAISTRLSEAWEANVLIGRYTPAELALVAVPTRAGLLGVPRVPRGEGEGGGSTAAARARLEDAGCRRPGPPPVDGAGWNRVAAALRETREPVTLYGDYAIVAALSGRPAVLADVRWHTGDGGGESRFYAGVDPTVLLQEVPLDDGWIGFKLFRADRGTAGVLGVCGMVDGDDLDRPVDPPSEPRMPLADLRAGSTRWAKVRLERPEGGGGTGVAVTTLVTGRYDDQLWIVDGPGETAVAEWLGPQAFGDRIAGLVNPAEGTGTWLDELPDPPSGEG